ncbi:hypothetical protein HPP92_011216 [Vanilla planifolia]|uniref:Uncharacterized protein n=1 Tax=Vanilla planifolia TaxID=51239 RepID=A0A835RBZ2_VANPL|nr:hypothetical protein HPP92_011216 [Vanilla planifolia]
MGEGLKALFDEIYSASLVEEEEDLLEDSDSGGESEDSGHALSQRRGIQGSPPSGFASNNPLYDFSSVIEQLPHTKGLSKYYQGKSQSFTSLLEVKLLEDLPRKDLQIPSKRKIKPCKSYAGGLDHVHKSALSSEMQSKSFPKKAPSSSSSCASSIVRSGSCCFLGHGGRLPPVPLHKQK